jgi:hypothetical protein
MANEVSFATLLSNGGRVAAMIGDQVHLNLYDPANLRGLMTMYTMAGPSSVQSVAGLTRGYTAAAASSEISGGASNTALTTTNKDITIARYLLQMAPTDLFALTSPGAPINVTTVADAITESMDLTLTSLLTGLFSGISTNVGTSGADLTVTNIFSAIFALNLNNNPAQLAAVLHNQQINDLMSSIRGEGGAIQYRADAQGVLSTKGVAARFRFLEVDFYQSSRVATANAGADRQGAMFSAGAFGYKLGNVDEIINQGMVNPADILIRSPEMFIERSRDAANGLSKMILNFYPGVAEIEDLRAVAITTDA